MQRNVLFRCAALSLTLCALFLNGCDNGNGVAAPGNPNAITTASASGNIQAQIIGVTVNSPPVVTFALSDETGQPLDPNGVLASNSGNRLRFFIAQLDATGNYKNYITDSSGLPTFDGSSSGGNPVGSFATVSPGVYTYTFGADIKTRAFFDATRTHTVAMQILRNVTKNGKPFQQISNPYFNFVPSGAAVAATREVVSISACNQCHGKLGAHGGSRVEIALCILCHNAGAATLATGQSIDFKQMIHKIHMSRNLPSKGYFTSTTFQNFSTVTYPVFSADALANTVPMDCVKCHQAGTDSFGKSYGKNIDNWKTNPTIAACTSCHNTTSFNGSATGTVDGVAGVALTAHTGGTQADGSCSASACHPSTGAEYGISVPGIHTVWEKSATNQGIVAKVISASNVGFGKYPRVTFQVTDAAGNPIVIDPGTTTPFLTGPNQTVVFKNNVQIYFSVKPKNGPDFLNTKPASDPAYFSANVQGLATSNSGGQVQVNQTTSLATVDASKGIYFINFSTATRSVLTGSLLASPPVRTPTPLPRQAGDYATGAVVAFAVQATRSDIPIVRTIVGTPTTTVLGSGVTVSSSTILNPVTPAMEAANVYYDLGSGLPATQDQFRRKVVDNAKCIACHNIIVGGPGANGVPVLHSGGRPNAEACVLCHGPNKNESDFKFLIHRFHTGKDSTGAQTNGAQAGSRWLTTYQGITYPNDRRRCDACHIDANPALPLPNPASFLASGSFPTRQDTPFSISPGTTAFTGGFSYNGGPGVQTTMPATNRIPPVTAVCLSCHDGVTGTVAGASGGPTGHAIANYGTAPNFSEQCSTCHSDAVRQVDHQLPN